MAKLALKFKPFQLLCLKAISHHTYFSKFSSSHSYLFTKFPHQIELLNYCKSDFKIMISRFQDPFSMYLIHILMKWLYILEEVILTSLNFWCYKKFLCKVARSHSPNVRTNLIWCYALLGYRHCYVQYCPNSFIRDHVVKCFGTPLSPLTLWTYL